MKSILKSMWVIGILIAGSSLLADSHHVGNENMTKGASYIDKFHAQKIVQDLSKHNLEELDFIEIISKNFGYPEFYNLKKDYWTSRMLMIKGDVIQARIKLEKNKEDIAELLKKIADGYKSRTKVIYTESIRKISEYDLQSMDKKDPDARIKVEKNNLRIKIVNQHMDNAFEATVRKRYMAAIQYYRSAKGMTIVVLKDLSGPAEMQKILNKYRIDLADNRNEVYKENM